MRIAVLFALATLASAAASAEPVAATAIDPPIYDGDGRLPIDTLYARVGALERDPGWQVETIHAYDRPGALSIRAWRTRRQGGALWILAGIHGEEPAGPNAIAASIDSLRALAGEGVPMVIIPLCNPLGYRHNWRYPNTAERDWRKGGYSVGDAEYLLPDLETGATPRAAAAPGPDTLALTDFVLRLAASYPPLLVLDLHEDELSTAGGYIYSQGQVAHDNPVGAEVIRLLQAAGMPLRLSGRTRFDEPIVNGVISRGEDGAPVRDGSIDELFAAGEIFQGGRKRAGPRARTVIVVETPAFAGSRLQLRVAAQGAVLNQARALWRLNAALPGQSPAP